ncbi:hypothetical protein PHYBLDRAFT_73058 [Phycomyces blakesleeanus NRRL 1555(-)]|uniref:Uncharacterized protein n=1 Tax=Phycomyces blakesleeanus (strain ATCC 8743b / DSM 1359 / FGSC 10004 / NBRC 33097 / NRRL 1555) TaxID=763407 RepID=A0A163AD25_PHYB8|nr:hypothetical protein PHYBLDRAFT_73058 [Phycomyces blakesleeanus NRRL 1555(-)]OAD72651.1 hypothetical protein PHYBLDRAFT_73058 [Phycomyces blakesleeanus NRRL 1555(-)]|eukprot:XP_018290691.1 hypothetical protein PHYBLDRAFT_73058 [Phycomyces blakesleeanus NRRL 1555(-)]
MDQVSQKNGHVEDVAICLVAEGPQDQRRYNTTTADEVVILIMNNERGSSRDIVLHTQTNQLQKINEYHRSYDALHYVLLFPSEDYDLIVSAKFPDPVTKPLAYRAVCHSILYGSCDIRYSKAPCMENASISTTTTNTSINMTNIQQEAVNEVNEFLDACYVLASEAYWKIFLFKLHQEHPTHQRLALHLENSQLIFQLTSFGQRKTKNGQNAKHLTEKQLAEYIKYLQEIQKKNS